MSTTVIYTYGHTLSLHDALPICRCSNWDWRWWQLPPAIGAHRSLRSIGMGAIGKPCRGSAALSLAGSPLTRAGDCRWQLPPARSRTERAFSVSAHGDFAEGWVLAPGRRSEEHTSELQSLMRTSYAVF